MPKLRSHSPSILSEDLLNVLEKCSLRITSVEQFLSAPQSKLVLEIQKYCATTTTQQQQPLIDHQALTSSLPSIRKKLLEFYACSITTAEQLLKHDQDLALFPLSCGSNRLDQLLTTGSVSSGGNTNSQMMDNDPILTSGGIAPKQITELFGPQATGKTMFCLSTALSLTQYRTNYSVLYIDSQNSFCERKLATMYERRRAQHFASVSEASSYSSQAPGEFCTLMEMMTKIRCAKAFDIFQLMDILTMVVQEIQSDNELFYSSLRLIVIDSIGQILLPSVQTPVGDTLMYDIVQQMRILASEYNISFLVTNLATQARLDSNQSNTLTHPLKLFKPTLGEIWKSVPSTRLFLLKTEQSAMVAGRFYNNRAPTSNSTDQPMIITRRAFLSKSINAPLLGEPVEFRIDATGIVDDMNG